MDLLNSDVNENGPESPTRLTAEEMDENRYQNMAHEYLCRLKEAREWIQKCLKNDVELAPLIEFEESLRNGVILARVANFISPESVPIERIFDLDQTKYKEHGLFFRHTDNISRFLKVAEKIGVPRVFYPEVVDIYDKKNMPKAIYCIHALSIFLHKRFGDKFPKLTDVAGVAQFSEEEISAMAKELAKYGITMPAFGKIGGILANEMPIDQVALHAAIISINETVEKKDPEATLESLRNPNAHLSNIRESNRDRYQRQLLEGKKKKRASVNLDDSLNSSAEDIDLYSHCLTREEIQDCIDGANGAALVDEANEAIDNGDLEKLLRLLRHPNFGLGSMVDQYPEYYLKLLEQASSRKGIPLTREEIRDVVGHGQHPLNHALQIASLSMEINNLVDDRQQPLDPNDDQLLALVSLLRKVDDLQATGTGGISDSKAQVYHRDLRDAQIRNKETRCDSEWIAVPITGDITLYANVPSGEVRFSKPPGDGGKYLDLKEISEVIKETNNKEDESEAAKAAAQDVEAAAYQQQLDDSLNNKRREEDAANRDEAARRIQAYYRKHKHQRDFRALMSSPNPSLYVVQKFATLLNDTDIDYEEELEIDRLRHAIREEIRQHKKYEKQLDELDLQIGLLVRNRIIVDQLSKGTTEERKRRQSGGGGVTAGGGGAGGNKRASVIELNGESKSSVLLDSLTVSGRQNLHAYQNLLYFLTRNPKYLSKLLITKSRDEADHFAQNLILPCFNYGTGSYEEYLLLRFFKTAVDDELEAKVANFGQIQSVNLIAIDQLVKFIRQSHGDQYKQDVLQKLLDDLSTITDPMDTNPVEVYRKWTAEQDGGALPKEVTPEEAFSNPEVKRRIHDSVTALERWVSDFLDAILKNLSKIPYSLRYSCKALRARLMQKFPSETINAVSKSAGDALLAHFLHACLSPEKERGAIASEDERSRRYKQATMNVARLIRCTIINKGYNEEFAHLVEFNGFIKQCHQRFKSFFVDLCDVPEPEEYFDIDEYVDYVATTKPVVVLHLGDLIDLHKLLIEKRPSVTSGPSDPLNELLDDFGPAGQPNSMIETIDDNESTISSGRRSTEVVLTLTNKFGVPGEEDPIKHEFLRTKKYLVDIILCQRAGSVKALLVLPVNEQDEKKHIAVLENRRANVRDITPETLTLTEKKAATLEGLNILQQAGLVSSENDYSEIITAIARDIRSRRRYRVNRSKERARLSATLEKLIRKSNSYRERIDYYDKYLWACLNSMPAQNKKRDSADVRNLISEHQHTKVVPLVVINYSAARLADKGVLRSIDDVARNAYKNVNFEIKTVQSDPGVFEVSTKFPGSSGAGLETDEIVLQKLLQLQFQNVQETGLFKGSRVKMNVSPLIALLNRKFFAKHKK